MPAASAVSVAFVALEKPLDVGALHLVRTFGDL